MGEARPWLLFDLVHPRRMADGDFFGAHLRGGGFREGRHHGRVIAGIRVVRTR